MNNLMLTEWMDRSCHSSFTSCAHASPALSSYIRLATGGRDLPSWITFPTGFWGSAWRQHDSQPSFRNPATRANNINLCDLVSVHPQLHSCTYKCAPEVAKSNQSVQSVLINRSWRCCKNFLQVTRILQRDICRGSALNSKDFSLYLQ